MKLSKSFDLREFIPPAVYNLYGNSSTYFVREDTVKMAQAIRDYFGKSMTINTWADGGDFRERGYRTPESPTGSKWSQHKLAAAIDFNIKGMTSDEVNAAILKAPASFLEASGITTIEHVEATPTWTHVDLRYLPPSLAGKILIVRPAEMTEMNVGHYNPAQDDYFILEEGELVPVVFRL